MQNHLIKAIVVNLKKVRSTVMVLLAAFYRENKQFTKGKKNDIV